MRKNSKKRYRSTGLTLESRVRSVSLKFYAEQLMPPKVRADYEDLLKSKRPTDQIKARAYEKHAVKAALTFVIVPTIKVENSISIPRINAKERLLMRFKLVFIVSPPMN